MYSSVFGSNLKKEMEMSPATVHEQGEVPPRSAAHAGRSPAVAVVVPRFHVSPTICPASRGPLPPLRVAPALYKPELAVVVAFSLTAHRRPLLLTLQNSRSLVDSRP